jgi:hypothetical protein
VEKLLLSAVECTYGAGAVRQTEMRTAETFVPKPSASGFEIAIGNLKNCKNLGVYQIPDELFQEGGEILHLEIHTTLNLSGTKRFASPVKRASCCTYSQKR